MSPDPRLRIHGRSGRYPTTYPPRETGPWPASTAARRDGERLVGTVAGVVCTFLYILSDPARLKWFAMDRPVRPRFSGLDRARRGDGWERLCGSASAPFQRLCRARRPSATVCGGRAAWSCYAGSHECVSCRLNPIFHTQSSPSRPIRYCGDRAFLAGICTERRGSWNTNWPREVANA